MTFPLGAAAVTQQPDAGEPLIRWDWLARHLDDIAVRTFEHIQLTAIAVGVGLVVSLALGLVAVRFRWTATPIGWFSGALYAIPSLAFFGLLIPFSGFSIFTAEIALVAYTLSTLVRNVIAGLDGVPPAARAAADGLGYTPTQRFFKVDLPLAVPTIVAGLRIATVTTISVPSCAMAAPMPAPPCPNQRTAREMKIQFSSGFTTSPPIEMKACVHARPVRMRAFDERIAT